MSVVDGVNKIASRAKGRRFEVDPEIDGSYLFRVLVIRTAMKIRGRVRFWKHDHAPSVGIGVSILQKKRISLGRNVMIGNYATIDAMSLSGAHFGDNVAIGRNTRIECTGSIRHIGAGISVGNNVGLGTDNFYGCAGGIEIGDDCIVGNFTSFHSENHNAGDLEVPIHAQGVSHEGITIGKDCWIGAKVTVLDGANVGDGCIIAAGAVVAAGKYPGYGIYGGVPARLLKSRR